MLPIEDRDKLPDKPGIYRVLDGKQNVIYVGQARDLRSRWNSSRHFKLDDIEAYCKANKTDAFIDWVLISEDMLNRVENCAVRFYQPMFNKVTPPVL